MLLNNFINNISKNKKENKAFLKDSLLRHLLRDGLPSHKVEEWKSFDTNIFSKTDWYIPTSNIEKFSNIQKSKKNQIVFYNGMYDYSLSYFHHVEG